MRRSSLCRLLVIGLSLATSPACRADEVALTPSADTFVSASHTTSNYGGAGALCVASAGQGEFQSVLRFDTGPAVSTFNTTFGAGAWTIQGVTLRLTAIAPVIPFFADQSPGQFTVRWMASDAWVEGSGTPVMPTTDGVAYETLPLYLGASDEALGTFTYDGTPAGAAVYTLALSSGFRADLLAGAQVSLRLAPASNGISYLFNSRSFVQPAAFPKLTITAAATPPCPADFNHSGSLTVQDIFDFLGAWFAGSPSADFNHAGGLSVQDIFDFLGAWFAGCP